MRSIVPADLFEEQVQRRLLPDHHEAEDRKAQDVAILLFKGRLFIGRQTRKRIIHA